MNQLHSESKAILIHRTAIFPEQTVGYYVLINTQYRFGIYQIIAADSTGARVRIDEDMHYYVWNDACWLVCFE